MAKVYNPIDGHFDKFKRKKWINLKNLILGLMVK